MIRVRGWLLLVAIARLVAVIPAAAGQGAADANPDSAYVATMTFDVASVRQSAPANSYTVSGKNPPQASSFTATNLNVRNLMTLAYGIDYSHIPGIPDEMERVRFNIQAKSDAETDGKLATLTKEQARLEKQHMLQTLLTDRFKLKMHLETKEENIFWMVVAKGGPKFKETAPEAADSSAEQDPDKPSLPPLYQQGDGRRGYQFFGHGATMEQLAGAMASQFATNVIDKTALTGKYDFTLQYNGTIEPHEMEGYEPWPPLKSALPDQLGLRLEPAKGPLTTLVIDHIEMPSEN